MKHPWEMSIEYSPRFCSASSEDSAENHDEREAASAASLASNEEEEEEETMSKSPEAVDEEAEEAREVTKLLSGTGTNLLSGGILETQFGDLMMSASGRTPTPPMEDTGRSFYSIAVKQSFDHGFHMHI